MSPSKRPLRRTPRRRTAEEWSLVLVAEGLSPRIERLDGEFGLWVDAADATRAEQALAAYEAENRAVLPQAAPEPFRYVRAAAAIASIWIVLFLVTGPRSDLSPWFVRGSADAARIASGEIWRTVTALTLHADWVHVLGNAAAGTLFLAALFQSTGPGVGAALVLAAGALGNLVNAMARSGDHVSVGASTAVFGAVGLLAALGVVQRRRGGWRGRRAWLPVAGGLGLLGMLGVGERADLGAHLFGFLTGATLGLPVGVVLSGRPGRLGQLGASALAGAVVLASWLRAFS